MRGIPKKIVTIQDFKNMCVDLPPDEARKFFNKHKKLLGGDKAQIANISVFISNRKRSKTRRDKKVKGAWREYHNAKEQISVIKEIMHDKMRAIQELARIKNKLQKTIMEYDHKLQHGSIGG